MSDIEFINETISDLHKDVYGFRPSSDKYAGMSDAELTVEFNRLCKRLVAVLAEERQDKLNAQKAIENEIGTIVSEQGVDRATALRWIISARGMTNDVSMYGMEIFEDHIGVHSGYLANT